jgi:hypothetical protein
MGTRDCGIDKRRAVAFSPGLSESSLLHANKGTLSYSAMSHERMVAHLWAPLIFKG